MQTPMHELEPVLQTPEKREKEVRKVRLGLNADGTGHCDTARGSGRLM